MAKKNYIQIQSILSNYSIDIQFIEQLEEVGRLNTVTENNEKFIPENELSTLEKMLRMNTHLGINPEGIDTVFHLLERMEQMQERMRILTERLRALDDDWEELL